MSNFFQKIGFDKVLDCIRVELKDKQNQINELRDQIIGAGSSEGPSTGGLFSELTKLSDKVTELTLNVNNIQKECENNYEKVVTEVSKINKAIDEIITPKISDLESKINKNSEDIIVINNEIKEIKSEFAGSITTKQINKLFN